MPLNQDDAAMPTHQVWDNEKPEIGWISGGLTARHYAAIALKVPDSGEPWLDEMIRKSRRADATERFAAFPNTSTSGARNITDVLYPEGFEL